MAVEVAPGPRTEDAKRVGERAERVGERAERHAAFPWLARGGLLARGVVYGVIGVIAIKVATGTAAHPTNQKGALEIIAGQRFGSVLLGLLAAGLAGYCAWRLLRAAIGHGREETDGAFDRVAAAGSGIAYLLLFAVAIGILLSAGGDGGNTTKQAAGVLGWPAGPPLVALAGAILIGVGLFQAYKAIAKKFMDTSRTEQMDRPVRRAYAALGVFGHLARAVVFVLVGYGLIRAAADYDPHKAVGLDGALSELARASYGPQLLGLVAAGLIAFAVYSAADARYRKI